jgi:type II secretory pathway component PulF
LQNFLYRAVDRSGSRRTSHAVATSPAALVEALTAQGLLVVEWSEVEAAPTVGTTVRRHRKTLIEVTRAIAGLLAAGLPLSRALTTAQSMTASPYREGLDEIHRALARGETLAAAMSAHPNLFPPFYLGLVRAGERSAELPAAFARLAAQLEREDELRARLGSAAIYPALLAVVGTAAMLLLMLFVLPRFAGILENAGAHLPRSTQLLLAISAAARDHWFIVISPIASVPVVIAWIGSTEQGARAWAEAQLRIPGLQAIRRDILAARFARLTSVLLEGGTPVLGALDNAAISLGDPVARVALLRVRAQVREGRRLSTALRDTGLLPALLAQLVALGEETGRLHEFLRKAADLFEQRCERTLARLVALAEPLMIVVLALVVGSVALSLLQAIYGVNASAFR